MTERDDWPYIVRDGLPVVREWRSTAEFVLDLLNGVVEGADEAGVFVRVRTQDGATVDLSGRRYVAVEWVTPSGDVYFVEALDVVGITEAAEMLGIARSALYGRVTRAQKAGEPMPFRKSDGGEGSWYAYPEAVKEWAASWTGRRAIRRKPVSS